MHLSKFTVPIFNSYQKLWYHAIKFDTIIISLWFFKNLKSCSLSYDLSVLGNRKISKIRLHTISSVCHYKTTVTVIRWMCVRLSELMTFTLNVAKREFVTRWVSVARTSSSARQEQLERRTIGQRDNSGQCPTDQWSVRVSLTRWPVVSAVDHWSACRCQ